MDCSPPGSSVNEISQARVGCHFLFQGIFPNPGIKPAFPTLQVNSLPLSHPGLPNCRWILYQLSHRDAQEYWSSLSLLQRIFLTQISNRGLLHCKWILYQLSHQGSYDKYHQFSSVQFSRSVVSDSLRPHESQHARPHCPSPTPGVHSNSCPSSW